MSNKSMTPAEAFLLMKDLDALLVRRNLDEDDAEIALVILLAHCVDVRGESREMALQRISHFFMVAPRTTDPGKPSSKDSRSRPRRSARSSSSD